MQLNLPKFSSEWLGFGFLCDCNFDDHNADDHNFYDHNVDDHNVDDHNFDDHNVADHNVDDHNDDDHDFEDHFSLHLGLIRHTKGRCKFGYSPLVIELCLNCSLDRLRNT